MKNELIDLATIKKKRQRELYPSRNGLEQYGQNIRDWLFGDSKIATISGKRSVFELKAGDLVLTRDRGFKPLESIEKLDTDQIENGNISVLPVQWNKSGEKPTTGSDQDPISVSRSQAYRLACSQGEMIMQHTPILVLARMVHRRNQTRLLRHRRLECMPACVPGQQYHPICTL